MNITNREKEVLYLISYGHTIKEIAQRLYISPHTVLSHKKNLFEKLKVKNSTMLVRKGIISGLVSISLFLLTIVSGWSQPLGLEVEGRIIPMVGDQNLLIGTPPSERPEFNGRFNTFLGHQTGGFKMESFHNTNVGWGAGRANDGNNNSYVGWFAGGRNFSGVSNVMIGSNSGKTPGPVNSIDSSVFVGAYTNASYDSLKNVIVIGHRAQVDCNNCAVIGGTDSNTVDLGIGLSNPQTPLHIKNKLDGALNPEAITLEDIDDSDTWELNTFSDLLAFDRNGVNKAYIDPNDGSYNATSDIRLKKNIKALESVLDRIKKIGAYRYQFKEQNNSQFTIGVIAQEVETIFPELVKNTGKHLSVNYDSFGPIAIQAIKEQQQIIEELKQSNKALTARLSAIENLISGIAQNRE